MDAGLGVLAAERPGFLTWFVYACVFSICGSVVVAAAVGGSVVF